MSKNFWHDIESGSDIPEIINVVIEIPKGSMNKYEYDKKHNMIKLDRVLFSPFHYPGDYGLIPQTLSEDGDALDALVESCLEYKTGARGLRSVVEKALLETQFDLPAMRGKGINKIIVTRDTVENNGRPILVYDKEEKPVTNGK